MQNELLLSDIRDVLGSTSLEIRTNHEVPTNDGGVCLGQAALGAL